MRRFSVEEFSKCCEEFNSAFGAYREKSKIRIKHKIDISATHIIFSIVPYLKVGEDLFLSRELYDPEVGESHGILYLSDKFYSIIEMIVGDIFGEKLSWNNTRSSGFICVDKVLSGEEILGELKRLDDSIRRDEDSLSLKNKTLNFFQSHHD